ncbi:MULTISPECIES: hypothetical protein [unclassified Mesorhizobium]|uniref:hypothetical protein n=1 Tax=unclassified Mesorhizobium TaxID=325217 RepID=UPI001FE0BFF6|nr:MULTISPECIES: hypothetical protein [unclassified Mesorhizobium]
MEVIVEQYAEDALVGDRATRLMTWEAKYVAAAAPSKICPAQIGGGLATVLRDISIATFRACQCRDYARVDLRIDRSGQPFVLEINANPSLTKASSYCCRMAR